MQQGHYWSYLRAEPFCAGFGGFSVWGKLVGYPISCHVIFPLQRYVISGRLYLEGNFVRGPIFHIGQDIEASLVFVWVNIIGGMGEGINRGSRDQSQGCIMGL